MNFIADFTERLMRAAKVAGVDISGLKVETCKMDQNYGDLVGLFFSGPQAERAARYFHSWATFERLGSDYHEQYSRGEVEAWTKNVYKPNGAKNFYKGHLGESNPEKHEQTHGYAVSFVYYPSAE